MILAVVPAYELTVCLCEREEVVAALSHLLPLLHLGKKPTAADNSRSLKELKRTRSVHLATDDALEVAFNVYVVDTYNILFVNDQTQCAKECLTFSTLPVEIFAYNYVFERETRRFVGRTERELAIHLSVPQQTAIAVGHFLFAGVRIALGGEVAVETEAYGLSGEEADRQRLAPCHP